MMKGLEEEEVLEDEVKSSIEEWTSGRKKRECRRRRRWYWKTRGGL